MKIEIKTTPHGNAINQGCFNLLVKVVNKPKIWHLIFSAWRTDEEGEEIISRTEVVIYVAPTFNKDATGVIKKTSDKVWLIRLLLIRLQVQLQDSLGTNEVYTIFQWLIIHKLRWQELSG